MRGNDHQDIHRVEPLVQPNKTMQEARDRLAVL
jgi:hypothetical protein